MKTNKNKKNFSIDSKIRKVYDEKTKIQKIVENNKKHEYDLNNENIYKPDGTCEREAEPWQYENAFRGFFIDANLLNIELFLNWHLENSDNQKAYLTYVKTKIFYNSTIDEGIKCIVGEWLINQNKKQINENINDEIFIKNFKDIFVNPKDFEKYIDALKKTTPALLDKDNEFIGNPYGHKGVICSWFKELQNKQIIKLDLNRIQLALIVNQEIKNFTLDKHGKTFDNYSKKYVKEFKNQLFALSGLK